MQFLKKIVDLAAEPREGQEPREVKQSRRDSRREEPEEYGEEEEMYD